MRGKRGNFVCFCFLLHDSSNHLRAKAVSPDITGLIDRTKENARRNSGSSRPGIDACFHPIWNGNGSYVADFADKIGDDPVLLPLLNVLYPQRR
jgi:hypothetical protein